MNNRQHDNEEEEGEAMVGKLIAAAGRGPSASAEARDRIYATVHARWQQSLRRETATFRHSSTRRFRVFGMAAAVALSAVVLYLLQTNGPELAGGFERAQFARIEGDATLMRGNDSRRLASPATAGTIATGDVLRTGSDGRLALRLDSNLLLRVNIDSEIVFADASTIELVAGTVYVDSGAETADTALEIRTELGAVSHLGTQYEVHLADTGLRLRVREGRVQYNGFAGSAVGAAGDEIEIRPDGATVRGAIASDATAWNWATALATVPAAAEYRLGDVLRWLAREQGLALEFPNEDAERRWNGETIFGLADLTPPETLDVLERTTDIRLATRNGRLLVLE
jgi:ferric-dicitrate binding protein FerR (iron transport regulator)